jgi:thioredoxin-dependent peroxiredoxin
MIIPPVAAVFFGGLKPGDLAPEFEAPDADGTPRRLSAMLEHGPVVLAFFPRAFTPGCTAEMRGYRDKLPVLEQNGAQLLAISTDDAARQKAFRERLEARFIFVPDPEARLATLYGVKAPLLPVAKRRTFVIGQDRRIVAVFAGREAVDPAGALGACKLP